MSYLTYNPATNRYPIRGFSNPNAVKSPDAIVIGNFFFRVDWNNLLTEIAFYYEDAPETMVILNGGNIVSFTPSQAYSTRWPWQYNLAILNDSNFGSGYTGSIGGTSSVVIELPNLGIVSALHLGGQSSNFNRPTVVSLYKGTDLTTWELVQTWNSPTIANSTGSKVLIA